MTLEIKGTPPDSITGNLKQALSKASWISESDGAAVSLALRLANALDMAFDTGEIKDVAGLAQRLTVILQQLHLTVETRTQGNKEEENNGNELQQTYLRLLKATPTKSKSKIT
jgi:hypothetical protein